MRKCTELDRQAILQYIANEPEMNVFIYGDIENFGVDTEVVSIFVHEREGDWDSLVLKYHDSYIVYSQKEEYEVTPVVKLLKERQIECISGKLSVIQPLTEYFPEYQIDRTYLCRCNEMKLGVHTLENAVIRELTVNDVEELIAFYALIEEFAKTYVGREEKAKEQEISNLEHGGKNVGVYVDGKLVAVAGTSASNSISAMVVGVATHPQMRGNGYAKAAVTKLCEIELGLGKQFLCLFYNNPDAGRLYYKVGFEPVGEYALFR